MRIALERITGEPFRWQETQSLDLPSIDRPELTALGEIGCRGEVRPIPAGFRLEATLGYQQTLVCGRCLAVFTQEVESALELILATRVAEPTTGELELRQEDLAVLFCRPDEELDTAPLIREQVLLNIPMSPLCDEQCAGLCPSCGNNRNLEPCDCAEKTVDPRWEALRSLRGD